MVFWILIELITTYLIYNYFILHILKCNLCTSKGFFVVVVLIIVMCLFNKGYNKILIIQLEIQLKFRFKENVYKLHIQVIYMYVHMYIEIHRIYTDNE